MKKFFAGLLALCFAHAAMADGIYGGTSGIGGATSLGSAFDSSGGILKLDQLIDPRDYGATCEGYQGISAHALNAGGSGYAVNDTFKINNDTSPFEWRNATGIVTSVSGGAVTGYTLTYAGAGYVNATGVATTATSGTGTGLTINITGATAGHNDTTAFQDALNASKANYNNAAVLVPQGCYVSSLTMPGGSTLMGFSQYSGYTGYSYKPQNTLFVTGTPNYVLDITANGQTISGFQIAGNWSTRGASTTCIGGASGNTGNANYGARITGMSLDMCNKAIGGNTSGHFFNLYVDNNYMSTSANGIWGDFSDANFHWNVGAGNAVTLNSGDWGTHRFSHNRWEWGTYGYSLNGSGFVDIDGDQIDEMTDCSIKASGAYWARVRGGMMRGGGGGGSFTVGGAVNNGSGLIRLTLDAVIGNFYGKTDTFNLKTGDTLEVSGVGGVTAANGTWTITVINGTQVDLQGSTFSGTYTSSTGVAAKPNADAYVCLNGTSARGFSLDGVGLTSPLAGDNPHGGTAYIFDVQSSGANNPNIQAINIPKLSIGRTANDPVLMGYIKWRSTAGTTYKVSGLGDYTTSTYGSMTEDGAGNVTFQKGVYENTVNLGSSLSGTVNIDLKAGTVFYGTVTGNTTFTVTNAPSGKAASFALRLTNAGAHTITWTNGLWASGTPATLTSAGTDWLGGVTMDGGTTVTYWMAVKGES